jgi:hypothetical protein
MLEAMTQQTWPPGNYYDLFGPFSDPRRRAGEVNPIDGRIFVSADGARVLRYQLPEAPIEVASLRIDGILFSTTDGKLVTERQGQVGTVNFDTGFIEIDIEASPDLGSRRVEYLYPRRETPTC